MTSPTSPAPTVTSLAYSIPAVYINQLSFTYINGVFRITCYEQQLLGGSLEEPEVSSVLAPRVAFVLTPSTAGEFLKTFGELFERVRANEGKDATWNTTSASEGTLQ